MNKGLTDELKAGFPDLVSENELRIPDLTLPQNLILVGTPLIDGFSSSSSFLLLPPTEGLTS